MVCFTAHIIVSMRRSFTSLAQLCNPATIYSDCHSGHVNIYSDESPFERVSYIILMVCHGGVAMSYVVNTYPHEGVGQGELPSEKVASYLYVHVDCIYIWNKRFQCCPC